MTERTDEALEQQVGRILRVGVIASSVCLSVGLGLSLWGVAGGATQILLRSGLVALLATPVSRVVMSTVAYTRSRDWVFAGLTAIVLMELMLSLIAALRAAATS
jgi:uncharacterized membrane protein